MKSLFKYLRPYTVIIIADLVLLFIQSLTELYLPTLMAKIVNRGIVQGDTSYILKIGSVMLLVATISIGCNIVAGYFSARVATGFGRDLRFNVFSRVESYSLNEFDKIGTSSLITRTTNDITQVQQILIFMLRMMVTAPMLCIGGIIMAVSMDATLSLIFIFVLPILAGIIYAVSRKGLPLFKKMQIKLDNLNRVFREGLIGIRVIRAFNRINHEKKRFSEANYDLTNTGIRVNTLMALLMPLMMLVMNLTTLAIVWFGGIRISQGNMQVGDMMAFIQYAMQIMFSLIMASFIFVLVPRAEVSAIRIKEVLNMEPEIIDNNPHVKNVISKKGLVEFKQVSFSYPGAEQPAIEDISFIARPGEVTAIIGGTGSGKTTLLNLIPRFYDVNSGNVFVDGVDVRDYEQECLRSKIGFVPQKSVLFSGTIEENIRFGNKEASKEEVSKAAEIAQALEFISNLKDGYSALITQGGTNLSGGQKQRLSIARALVRKPELYIFDDTFSALDYKTDALLRAALKKEISEATVLVVAQRVSTVIDADQILVMNEGRIVGRGKHIDLLNTCKIYQEIIASQLSEEEIA